tara:strand:+ start:128 stop:2647 length:2520 start_codon:yes stop_codon:yes gene_type:complete
MALNPFFTQGTSTEQGLLQSLVNEQLKMYGVEVHYLPREYITSKSIIKEVIQSSFNNAYPIEAYVENFEGYNDNTTLLSKFGIQSTQEITLIVSKERYENFISPLVANVSNTRISSRPKEGDLIYFPLGDRLFEIKFVEHEKPFYQLQKNYVYELRCELFRYEDEIIDTGVSQIDDTLVGSDPDGISESGLSTILGGTLTMTLVGTATTATAISGLVDGGIRSITLTNQGAFYPTAPTVAISSAPSSGITGVATVVMDRDSIRKIYQTNSGAGYTSTPLIEFISNTGLGAKATVGIATTGGVGVTTIVSGGAGYVLTPTVTFSTPKHVGAAATATLDSPIVGGGVSVVSAPVSVGSSAFLFPGGTTGGVFYKEAPSVVFALPTGTGNVAQATAALDTYSLTGGTVETLGLTTGGRFYTSAPTVTISHPGFSFASATIGIAGSSIDPGSVTFSSTGRAYTTAPNVIIGTGVGTHTPIQTAVGIATIHPITGVVTAVSFNVTDSWATGTGVTVGSGYTVTPSISFSGSPSPIRATSTCTIDVSGVVDTISVGNSGYGYASTPNVVIAGPAGADEQFRALGITTIRFNSIQTQGTLGISSTIITGITTTNIIVGDRVRLGVGYSDLYNFIPSNTFVSSIGVGSIFLNNSTSNVGIATSVFEFGIDKCGIVTGIAVTFGGGGYITPPLVSISNTVGDKNYINIISGISTATGIATISPAGQVTDILTESSGYGYVIPPDITISNPGTSDSGDFVFNEIVTGSTSGTKARVRTWDTNTNTLELGNVTGTFVPGETIVGSQSSATHTIFSLDVEPAEDGFAQNATIETEADGILDFTERNPFGIP